jgi:4-hydroxy-4-methyl-2-oxoglutarate aldolase
MEKFSQVNSIISCQLKDIAMPEMSEADIIAALMKSTVASVSDAIDDIVGQRRFMRTDMRPLFKTKIAGRAATVQLKPALRQQDGPNFSLKVLDEAAPGSILVYVLEDGLDIAGIGELMATTAQVRGIAGAVIDGGARDVEQITRMGFPVFCRSITPASIIGRHVGVAGQVPVMCAGIWVRPGDYVMGDMDGVVVIPYEHAQKIAELALEFDAKEIKMREMIRETGSILKAMEAYGRY